MGENREAEATLAANAMRLHVAVVMRLKPQRFVDLAFGSGQIPVQCFLVNHVLIGTILVG